MTGQELRAYLLHLDESYSSVAHKLGISPQSLDGTLKTKDIKTGLLERLSEIYNVPVSYFYDEELVKVEVKADRNSAATVNGNASVVVDDSLMAEKIKSLEAILREKDARIDELKECLEILKMSMVDGKLQPH